MVRYKSLGERLANSTVSSANKQTIIEFNKSLYSENISKARVFKYQRVLIEAGEFLQGTSFQDATEQQLRALIASINKKDWKPATKYDFKRLLRRFYRSLHDGETPKKIKWLKCKMRPHEKEAPKILTDSEIQRMLKACSSAQQKATLMVLWEAGLRLAEFRGMNIGSVHINSNHARLTVRGKTGIRTVIVVKAMPYLAAWINQHPDRQEPDSPLWISTTGTKAGQRISKMTTNAMLKKLAKKAGIKRRVYPHLFRHTSATNASEFMTEQQMKAYYGWTKASEMASVYTHLSGKHLEHAVLAANGLAEDKTYKPGEELSPQTCQRCKALNGVDNLFCESCSSPLSVAGIQEQEDELKQLRADVSLLMESIPQLKSQMEKEVKRSKS